MFDQDPVEKAQISGADFALMCDEMRGKDTEIATLKARIAELEARPVVVPELSNEDIISYSVYHDDRECFLDGYNLAVTRIHPIPADRVLGDGMVAVSGDYIDALENAANQYCGSCRDNTRCTMSIKPLGCGAWKLDAEKINAIRSKAGVAWVGEGQVAVDAEEWQLTCDCLQLSRDADEAEGLPESGSALFVMYTRLDALRAQVGEAGR